MLELMIIINCNVLNKWFGVQGDLQIDLSRGAGRFGAPLSEEVTESPSKLTMTFLTLRSIMGDLNLV